jgi:TnpA family transposase
VKELDEFLLARAMEHDAPSLLFRLACEHLINFAVFDLVGLQLSPRIRDLGKITLYRTGTRAATNVGYPAAEPLLTRRVNTTLIAENWDEMLRRVAASLKHGT